MVKNHSEVATLWKRNMHTSISSQGPVSPTPFRYEISKFDRWLIGDFTRKNVLRWAEHKDYFNMMYVDVQDFHAVFGDVNIPWATEEGRLEWERVHRRTPPKIFKPMPA